tara:strand:+ start:520 stop:1041 length:522 start_codon:yes stop_codon:yes gene_type:complete
MNNKTLLIISLILILFCFFVFLKSLNNNNAYIPDINYGKKLISFKAKKLSNNELINSEALFDEDKIYVLNIWSSWCVPCRAEHDILMELKKNPSIKIIGLNYKDSLKNAKKYIDMYGNPYSSILIDEDGVISISVGAYGVPESIIMDKNKIILKKFIGPINTKSLKEIESLTK